MLFSVCVPAYNCDKYIRKCIDSILAQEIDDYELIVVDDGSTDRTGTILDEYAEKYSFIHLFHTKNRGELMTRVQLVSLANGEYCVFVDSDDFIEKYTLKVLKEKIIANNKPDCILFGLRIVDQSENILSVVTEEKQVFLSNKEALYEKVLSDGLYNSVCRKCTRTEILRPYNAIGNEQIFLGADLLQSLHLYKHVKEILFIKDILYNYVMNNESVMHTINYAKFQPSYILANKVYNFLNEEKLDDSKAMLAAQIKFADSFTYDVIFVARFPIGNKEKIRLIKEVWQSSQATLKNNASKWALIKRMKKRYIIYVTAKHKLFSLSILIEYVVRFVKNIFNSFVLI